MVNSQVERDRIRGLYELGPTLLVGLFVSFTAIAGYFWNAESEQNRYIVEIWYAIGLTLITARAVLFWEFRKISKGQFKARYWANLFTLGVVVSGVLAGVAPVLFLDFSDPIAVVFLTLIMFGSLAGSLPALSYYPVAYYLYNFIALTPLVVLYYLQGGAMVIISLLLLVFMGAYVYYAKHLYKTVTRSIQQRFENYELMVQLKQQTESAEKANIDKSRLLAATSHDLRQPLHSLSLFLSVLKEKLTTVEQLNLMRQTEQSQQVLSDQLNAIIEITQIDAGELKIAHQPVSSKPMVERIVSEFSLLAERAGIEFRLRLIEAWIDTDPIIFARIIRNLISNAIQHCPNSSLLIASKRTKDGCLALKVIDNGPGIAESETQNVFSEFYQLNNPERDRNKGIGLGLSIVKRLSMALGVEIELRSRIGRGTAFTLHFPLSAGEYVEQPDHNAKSVPFDVQNTNSVAGLFVVLVDDEIKNLDAMKRLLLHWGAEVLTASGYKTLLDEYETFDYPVPDLMLVDYRLKEDMNGYELIQKMRAYFQAEVPAAIVTGDTTLNLKQEFLDRNVLVEYKPIPANHLVRLIQQLTGGAER